MLKSIAIITMLIDHIGLIFFPQFIIFRLVGRIAFPLFAWGVANGYKKTRNVKKYALRILLLALISQPIYFLVIEKSTLNICFGLFIGLISIYFLDKSMDKKINIIFLLIVLAIPFIVNIEYGIYGVLSILLFFISKNNLSLVIKQSLLSFVFILLNSISFFQILSLPAFFIINYFEKYDFKINRFFQYSFYPLHLLVIYVIKTLIN